jgi:hypothetical protein
MTFNGLSPPRCGRFFLPENRSVNPGFTVELNCNEWNDVGAADGD